MGQNRWPTLLQNEWHSLLQCTQYYLMVLSNNLFEAFKEDVTEAVIPVSVYADTFRRQFIDTAGKLVRHAGKLVMKVNKIDYVRLKFDRLFETC